MSYDPKCEELAEQFLLDVPNLVPLRRELAQAIQDAIEVWITDKTMELRYRQLDS